MPAANAKRKNIRPSASKVNKKVMNYIQFLEKENEKLRTDPDTALGQLVPQMREAVGQNKRLSVLAAALIQSHGGNVMLTKSALEAFDSLVLSIKWELPEGVTDPAQAEQFIFSYEALTREAAAAREAEAALTVTPIDAPLAEPVSTSNLVEFPASSTSSEESAEA